MLSMEEKRSIVVFNGNVSSNDLKNNVPNDFNGDIIIYGCLDLQTTLTVRASIWVFGDILEHGICSYFEVLGDLFCMGNCKYSGDLIIHGTCYCSRNLLEVVNVKAEELECDGLVNAVEIVSANIAVKDRIDAMYINYHGELNCKKVYSRMELNRE